MKLDELISAVEFRPGKGKAAANGVFTIADAFRIEFTIWKTEKGLWVSLPSKQGQDGKYFNQVSIVGTKEDKALYNEFQSFILEKWESSSGKGSKQSGTGNSIPF